MGLEHDEQPSGEAVERLGLNGLSLTLMPILLLVLFTEEQRNLFLGPFRPQVFRNRTVPRTRLSAFVRFLTLR